MEGFGGESDRSLVRSVVRSVVNLTQVRLLADRLVGIQESVLCHPADVLDRYGQR
jgi:hypothetical protein